MALHITAVNRKVMQLVNSCCGEVVLTSIEVTERVFSHVLKPHES